MNKQIILAVDDDGNFLEYIPKKAGHKGEGKRHLAITVLLFNSKGSPRSRFGEAGQVLLQKRKHKIFDNLWDFSGATHPLHKPHFCHPERLAKDLLRSGKIATATPDGGPRNDKKCRICNKDNIDESPEEAAERCLREEWDISPASPRLRGVKKIGEFNYFAPYHTVQGDFCENEHCAMIAGEYDGEVKLNPNAGYGYKWMDKADFLKDLEKNPKNYTPWAREGIEVLRQTGLLST